MTRQILFGLLVLGGWVTVRAPVSIDPIEFRLMAIEDSSSYFVYRYTAQNPATSTQSVAAIRLDVSAAVGTAGEALPATGYFFNGPAVVSSVPVTTHAPVGPISPANWEAYLERTAVLVWNGANGDMYDNDSIPPGGSLTGLGVRSPYLPGIRRVGGVPTWQSCCMTPWGTEEENPLRMLPEREDFMVSSYALGPEFTSGGITIGLLQRQLDTICTDPLWLNNSTLCSEFSSLLFDAQSSLTMGDAYAAAAKLTDLRDRVDAEQAQMEPEAYWLLHHNVRQAYRNVAPPLEVVDARGPGARADTTVGPSVTIRDSADDGGIANRPIWIEGGTFVMGTDDSYPGLGPAHEVTVSSFWIQEHEVTNEEFRRFDPTHRSVSGPDRHPVLYVRWDEAMAYAEWLGGSLPTEAQWEYAARGREGRTYPWGEAAPTCELAQYAGCGGTLPVMSLPAGATPEGVYDLAGNAAEWVFDRYGSYAAQPVTDPTGPDFDTTPYGDLRIRRGGAAGLDTVYLSGFSRPSGPRVVSPDEVEEMWFVGFRVAWPGDAGPDVPPTSR